MLSSSFRLGIAMAMRPLIRSVPLGKKYLFDLLPLDEGALAALEPKTRVFYDRGIKAWAYADFRWAFSRRYYFYGRYPADSLLLLFERWLRPGDVFVDVGAHWGIYTLAACRAVGPEGKVIAVEPNPASANIIEAQLTINGIRNCRLHRVGLSSQPAELTLRMPSDTDSSWCTFRPLEDTAVVHAEHAAVVPVLRADALLGSLPADRSILVKLDTEGYEHQALRGFGELLKLPRIAFVLEVTDEWLRATGTSAEELFADMLGEGFRAYYLKRWRNGLKRGVSLLPLAKPAAEYQYEVVFARSLPQSFT
jgi:FkbM family methyltransferase